MEKFIIIDGNSLANRAFYAMPYLSNRQHQPSGAVFGFANLLVKLIVEQKPDYVAVAFDHARKTFRNDIFAEYKGTRKQTPPDLSCQFPVIKQMLAELGIKFFESGGIEADDIIGTLSRKSDKQNFLVSGDRDLLQLVNDNTQVWLTRKGVTDLEKFDEEYLLQTWGVCPSGVIELKALMGDTSDNIPGVPGVGEKTAQNLIASYGDVDGIYQNIDKISGKLKEKLVENKDLAYMSKELATIKTDCEVDFDIEECRFKFPFAQNVRDFFESWDFRSLTARKDIFEEGVKSSKIEVERVAFESLDQVKEYAKNVTKTLCYDFDNMEFFDGNKIVYFLKKEIDLFSPMIDLSDIALALKDKFEDESVEKITNSSKSDLKYLKKCGIELKNYFDIEIARYVLYAGLPKLEAASVEEFAEARKELQEKMEAEDVLHLYRDVEMPLVEVLADMEDVGFKVDAEELDNLDKKYTEELERIRKEIWALAGGEFNINSPKQVAYILFEKLGLTSFNNKKQSTSFAILDEMRDQHEIVEKLIEFRKLGKLVSTYISVYKEICKSSGDIIHTTFNQTLTSTGRLSSSEPNMQNIPTRNEEGKNLRKIFVSKFENGKIISADYSQIELRLLANLANEETMIEAYNNGVDIHTKTASEIFRVPVDEVTSALRRDAKAVNFGIIYGISDYGLSQNIKTSVAKAKEYIENYFDRYPKIKEFMDSNVEYARKNGFIKSYLGRIRHIPDVKSSNANVRKFGERVAMNMPLQGTASDIIKMAMIKVWKMLKTFKCNLILQVHDELIVDCANEDVEKVEKVLADCMQNICDFAVPLTVSVSSGSNLCECK